MWGIIATWRMAYEGILEAEKILKAQNQNVAGDAIETCIKVVEDYPFYKSVGYGGLPNERGIVELDAAFMDGKTLAVGAVAGMTDIKNPISVARKLSENHYNSFLVGKGADEFATVSGFEKRNMLTPRAKKIWEKKVAAMVESGLKPYDGHDTVGVVALDQQGEMAAGTSTSGLFMKKPGRVGDSPVIGSGFYADSKVGGACATGLGEDIMKGCISYEIVRQMKEGKTPQQACDETVYPFVKELENRYGKVGEFSVVAMDCHGNYGVATNVEFTFSVATAEKKAAIFIAYPKDNQETSIQPITKEWLEAYEKRIKAPIE